MSCTMKKDRPRALDNLVLVDTSRLNSFRSSPSESINSNEFEDSV